MDRNKVSRRTFVALTGATVSAVSLAGCAEDDGEGNGGGIGEDDTPMGGEEGTPTPEGDETPTPEGDETPTPEGDETPTPEGGEGGNGDPAVGEWEDVEEIQLEGRTENWVGVEPAPIEGEENPTLVLFEGQQYTVTWENMDGAPHDFVLWDDNDEEIEGTDIMDEEGETQSLEFEATEDMTQYVCTVHPGSMLGEVDLQTEGDGE